MVMSMVKGALEYVDLVDVIRVRVNPDDFDVLRTYWEDSKGSAGARDIELSADPSVQLGGCIIDTKGSIVDAQIGTKLAEIERAFLSDLNASSR